MLEQPLKLERLVLLALRDEVGFGVVTHDGGVALKLRRAVQRGTRLGPPRVIERDGMVETQSLGTSPLRLQFHRPRQFGRQACPHETGIQWSKAAEHRAQLEPFERIATLSCRGPAVRADEVHGAMWYAQDFEPVTHLENFLVVEVAGDRKSVV